MPMSTDRVISMFLAEVKQVNANVSTMTKDVNESISTLRVHVSALTANYEATHKADAAAIKLLTEDVSKLTDRVIDMEKSSNSAKFNLALPVSIIGFITAILVAVIQLFSSRSG
jgi:flagellar hook-basal body complex protein FliE